MGPGVRFLAIAACAARAAGSGIPDVAIAPGVSMPMLALGTMPETLRGCSARDAVKMWLALGGRHIDMSKWYHTEREVAEGLAAAGVPREELFLTAKIEGPIGYERALRQFAEYDLPRLGVEYLDLLLVHMPCVSGDDFPDKCGPGDKAERLDTWRALEELKAAGKVRAIGVSNFALIQLQQLYDAGYRPAVNQVQWHLGYHNNTLLRSAMLAGTHLEAWAPLAGPVPVYSEAMPGVGLWDPRLAALAAKYGASPAQVAIQWMVRNGVTPVTGSCTESHLRGDLASFGFHLSSEDAEYLDALEVAGTGELAAAAAHAGPAAWHLWRAPGPGPAVAMLAASAAAVLAASGAAGLGPRTPTSEPLLGSV